MFSNHSSEELELVNRVKKGSRKAQYELYKRYVDAMYHTALRILNNKADAQDAVQECFVKVFEKIHSYRNESTIGAWIKVIAVNAAINHIRRKKNKIDFPTDNILQYEHAIKEDINDSEITPNILHEYISNLPSGCRIILNLYSFEGYSHQEISGILNISESTSKTQFRRAKSILQRELKTLHFNEYQ